MRVAVLGAGYAGVTLARRLERNLPESVDVVLVDDTGTHLVRHEVHRVVRRPSVAEVIEVPLDDIFERTEVITDRVESVDADARRAVLEDGDDVAYDYAAVCLGSETAFYGIPGVETHARPLKEIADAENVREDFLALGSGERAVVGGAGLSGVQVAGELAALGREAGVDADVVLLEQMDEVAPKFPANFRRAVGEELAARDVEIRTNETVVEATEDAVVLDSGEMPYGSFVWTGGIEGTDAMGRERPLVRDDLRVDRRTFVVGDAARVIDADGEAVPASASAAVREARTVAANLADLVDRELDGEGGFEPQLDRYRFEAPGWIVSVGDGAVAQLGSTVLTGSAAKAMKATVGAGHLGSVGAVRRAVELAESELD